jgi:hypothetical protein
MTGRPVFDPRTGFPTLGLIIILDVSLPSPWRANCYEFYSGVSQMKKLIAKRPTLRAALGAFAALALAAPGRPPGPNTDACATST